MNSESKRIPSSSQTVGPYFRIGLEYLIGRTAQEDANAEDIIEIRGRVLDRDGAPVPDAMLEFWSAAGIESAAHASSDLGVPDGFRRVGTDLEGSFAVKLRRPIASRLDNAREQAPHTMVLVFARGLQRHLITRMYLEDEAGNENDLVLQGISEERRRTLIAKWKATNAYQWDVILQGPTETVFFAW